MASAQAAYQVQAQQVSRARHQAAPRLAQAITQAMQGLGMAGGRFDVQLDACEPSSHGLETVQFLVAGHPGSTPRPMGKVASGGELSRIALAIAVTTSRLGTAQTLIFDEVDAPLDDANIDKFNNIIKKFSKDSQFIIITHNKRTVSAAQAIYGVTMEERGVSKTVSMKFNAERGEAEAQSATIADSVRGARPSAEPAAT